MGTRLATTVAALMLSTATGGMVVTTAPVASAAVVPAAAVAPTSCETLEVIAHRGLYPAGIDMNTVEAFELAAAKGYSVEMDVWPDANGKLWVFHDRDVSRETTHPRAFIDEMRSRKVAKLRYEKSGSPLASFEDALDALNERPELPVYVEPKATAVAIAAAIKDSGRLESTWMTSAAFVVHKAHPEIRLVQKVDAGEALPAEGTLRSKGVDTVALTAPHLTTEIVASYQQVGIRVQGRNSTRTRMWRRVIASGADAQLTGAADRLQAFCPVALRPPVIRRATPAGRAAKRQLTVRGRFFYDVSSVLVAGRKARSKTISPGRLVVNLPARTRRTATLEVTNPNGTVTKVVRTR